MNGRSIFFVIAVLAMSCIGSSARACYICYNGACLSSSVEMGHKSCSMSQGQCYTSGSCNKQIEIPRVVRFPRGNGTMGTITIHAPQDLTREDALFVTKSLYLLTVSTLIHR